MTTVIFKIWLHQMKIHHCHETVHTILHPGNTWYFKNFFFNQYRWHKISHRYFYFHSFNEKLNIIPYFILFEMLFEFLMWFLVSLFYILIHKKVWYILGTNSILIIYMSHFSSEFGFAFHFLYCDFWKQQQIK